MFCAQGRARAAVPPRCFSEEGTAVSDEGTAGPSWHGRFRWQSREAKPTQLREREFDSMNMVVYVDPDL